MARVNLRYMPDPHPIKTIDFPRLTGGLNLRDESVQLSPTETPDCLNVRWDNGTLHSRPGLTYASTYSADIGTAHAVSPVFHGWTFIHSGTGLYAFRYVKNEKPVHDTYEDVAIPDNDGSFATFGDYLYYKNDGGFFEIGINPNYDPTDQTSKQFTVTNILNHAFVPTIQINSDPVTGSGDLYQPENRLSVKKRVLYTPVDSKDSTFYYHFSYSGGGTTSFHLGFDDSDGLEGITAVYANGIKLEETSDPVTDGYYTADISAGVITFNATTATSYLNVGDQYTVAVIAQYTAGVVYSLPVRSVDSVDTVIVNGTVLDAGTDYTVNLASGSVTLFTPPPVTVPPQQNSVEIIYSKSNGVARDAVMSCKYIATYGGGVQMCLVLGGSTAQPGVVFWSGNNNLGVDASYVPVDSYNLIGDSQDAVTGFGKQYSDLIAFQENGISKLTLDFQTVNDRTVIALNSERVNDKIGCDLPRSIQLVENNLVFANTGGGVYMLLSASAAYENNVLCISRKINGSETRTGLLDSLRNAGSVCSYDDGDSYYIHALSQNYEGMWVWQHDLSAAENPTWFCWNGFPTVLGLFGQQHKMFALMANGTVCLLDDTSLSDYGYKAIDKHYQFPAQNFGSYYREKEVTNLILSVPSAFPVRMKLYYQDDYGVREDLIDMVNIGFGQDIERPMNVSPYAVVFRKRPKNKHIKHFAFRLENNTIGEDLAIFSAQLQYRFLGKSR